MIRRPPRSTRTDTLFPYTTLFRSYPIPFIERFLGEIGAEGGQPAIDEQQQDEELARREADVPFVVGDRPAGDGEYHRRSEEHTSELQSLMRISYAVFCLKKKKTFTC